MYTFIYTCLWKYGHYSMPRHPHSHLHLYHTWYFCFKEGWGERFSLVDDHLSLSMKMPTINQIPISVECKDLIAKVDCSSLQDHRLKLREVWSHLWPNLILDSSIQQGSQKENSIFMTKLMLFLFSIEIPRAFHYRFVGITYSMLKWRCLSAVKPGHCDYYSTAQQHISYRQGLKTLRES